MIKFKKPEFTQRLTVKRIIMLMGGAGLVITVLGAAGFYVFGGENSKENQDQKIEKTDISQRDIDLDKTVSNLVLKSNASSSSADSQNSVQALMNGQGNYQQKNDITSSIVNAGNSQAGANGVNTVPGSTVDVGMGGKFVPLGSTVDTSFQDKNPVDVSKMTDAELENYYTQQQGKKIIKVGQYANMTNSPTNKQTGIALVNGENNIDASGNPIIGYDGKGNPIYGYDANGKPILTPLSKPIGKDKNGNPIFGYDKLGNPIYGIDANGKPILTPLSKSAINPLNTINGTSDIQNGVTTGTNDPAKMLMASIVGHDKSGNPIIGYDSKGNPIYGYDANGKPILTPLSKPIGKDKNGNPIFGYDKLGNPIYGIDKKGNMILGYTKDKKPIYGYDANGKPILTPLKTVLGYDSNGNAIVGYDASGKAITDSTLNTSRTNAGSAISNIAGAGTLGTPGVPALSGSGVQGAPTLSAKDKALAGVGAPNGGMPSGSGGGLGNGGSQSHQPINQQQNQQQEVDKTPPNVSLNFKDVKVNNGMAYYAPNGALIESTTPPSGLNIDYGSNGFLPRDSSFSQNLNQSEASSLNNKSNTSGVASEGPKSDAQTRIMLTNKYTVRAGDYIPAIMHTGLNSDLPGSITARVTQNVYDTATGQYLIIPQGSKLLGSYSANISYGQERIMAAWTQLIYPDGSIIKLQSQPGTDLAGYAGYNDLVNNHYWKLFGNTFILSVLTTGIGYSQNGADSQNGSGFNQQLSSNTGQLMGQAASTIIQKSINIAPTLTIRNGYPMNILLTQDIVIDSPYKLRVYY